MLIAAGVGVMLHAAIPGPVENLYSRLKHTVGDSYKRGWVNVETGRRFWRANGATESAVISRSEHKKLQQAGLEIKQDASGTYLQEKGSTNRTKLESTDGFKYKVPEGKGSVSGLELEIFPSRAKLHQDLHTKRYSSQSTGRRSFKKGIAGALVFGAGAWIAANNPSAGLVETEVKIDCNPTKNLKFSELSEADAYTKFACELGALQADLADLHLKRHELTQEAKKILGIDVDEEGDE